MPAEFQVMASDFIASCLKEGSLIRHSLAKLAMDIQRYLADEPVLAGPPTATYRLKKFIGRNKGPVIAASVILLCLVAGIIGTTAGLVWAVRERDAKEQARQDAVTNEAKARAAAEEERKANALAQKRLGQIEKANEILASVFRDLD